jgi:hypothetical protein
MFKLSKLALIGALSVAFVSCGSVAHADPNKYHYVTVEHLLDWYVSDSRADNEAVTMYIGGVHDAFAGVLVCSPQNAKLFEIKEAMIRGVVAAAEKDRAVLDLNAGFFIGQVMARVWPCVKGRNV